MTSYRSTTLKLMERHCARALDFYDAAAPFDRDVFETGIAAHAFLEVIANAKDPAVTSVAKAVSERLVTQGREFDGVKEPPLSVSAVQAGVALASAWLAENPIPTGRSVSNLMPRGRAAERGMAVTKGWSPTGYFNADAHYKGVLDLMWVEDVETEESAYAVAVTRDYKTSWHDTAAVLESIQMKGQALLLLAVLEEHKVEVDAVRLEVANLRTGRVYSKQVMLDEAGNEVLDQWRNDIDLSIRAADARLPDGKRPAKTGAGCMGCPYLMRCDAARAAMRGTFLEKLDAEGVKKAIGTRLAVADAMREELFEKAKMVASDGHIALDKGYIGYAAKESQRPVEGAMKKLAAMWYEVPPEQRAEWEAKNGPLLGLLTAIPASKSAIETAVKALVPFTRGDTGWKEKREQLLGELLETTVNPVFGVHRE